MCNHLVLSKHLWTAYYGALCLTLSVSQDKTCVPTGVLRRMSGCTKTDQWWNLITWHLVCDWNKILCSTSCISDQLHILSNQLQMKVWFYEFWIAGRRCQTTVQHQMRPWDDAGHQLFQNFTCLSFLHCRISHQLSSEGWRTPTTAPLIFHSSLPTRAGKQHGY